jgi:hypothetical protein
MAVLAVIFVINIDDGSSVRETVAATVSAEAGSKKLMVSEHTGSVLKAIRNLKSYCMAAKEVLDDMPDFKDDKLRNGVVDFIAAFGASGEQDMVIDFAKTVGKLLARPLNNHGMALYLLEEINHRTLKGEDIVTKGGDNMPEDLHGKYMFDYDKLGFEFPPEYIEKLAVRATAYSDKQVALHASTGGQMFDLWEKTGKANAYEDMLARIVAKNDALAHAEDVLEYKGAKIAVRASFHTAVQTDQLDTALHPLPTAGAQGAAKVREDRGFKMPTQAEMEAEAMEQAKKFMASLSEDERTPEALIAEMENQLEGVTIEVGTTQKMFADSIQSPKIKIIGKTATIEGELSALPVPGGTLKHNFPRVPGQNLGHLLRVELEADEKGSPWLVSSFKLQQGYGNAWVDFLPQGSARIAASGFWLGEEEHYPYAGIPHQTQWLLKKTGSVEPVFRKSLVNGPPSCKDISCMHGTKDDFVAACKADDKCDGFTLQKESTDKFNSFKSSDVLPGCLKARCHIDGSGTGGNMDPTDGAEDPEGKFDYYQRVGFTMVQEKAEKANEKKLKAEMLASKESALSSEKNAKGDEKAMKKIAVTNVGEHEGNAKKYATDEATSKSEYSAAMKEREQKWLTPYWDVDTKQGSCTEAPCAVHADQHCQAGGDMIDTKKGCQRPGTTQTGCEFQCKRTGEPSTEFEHVDKPTKEKTFVKWVSSDIPMCPQRPCNSAAVTVTTSITCHQVIDDAIVTDSMCIDDGKAKPDVISKTCQYERCPKATCAGKGGAVGGAQERCCVSYGYGGNGHIDGGCAHEIFSETGDYEERRECRNGRYRCRSATATHTGCYWNGGYCAPNRL